MSQAFDATFETVLTGLLIAPALALCVFVRFTSKRPQSIPAMIAGAMLTLLFVIGLYALGFSSAATFINPALIIAAYFSYCLIAASTWEIRNRLWRVSALIITTVPICIGYLLATAGSFILAIVVIQFSAPPTHVEVIRAGLRCEVPRWGMAFTDSGYNVTLYPSWVALPFIQRKVASISVGQTHPGSGPVQASCSDALAAYAG